ncbi:MAG TPA: penicillin-binding protein activator LpoB [Pseudomonadales bacterium]|nr:penicillin-binding protein activator LpoB [Pseudomonadales bacterium]
MKKILVGGCVLVSAILFTGCASKVEYGDAQAVETVNTDFGSTDLHQIAAKMVDSLIASPAITQRSKTGGAPIVVIDRIKNKTDEHIDTESVTDTISTKMLQSGRFQIVDQSNLERVKEQLSFQNDSGYVDPAKAVKVGTMVGAQYMLYGNMSSIVKNNKSTKDVYYKFTLQMMDLKSGTLVWKDEKEIRKQMSRSMFGM